MTITLYPLEMPCNGLIKKYTRMRARERLYRRPVPRGTSHIKTHTTHLEETQRGTHIPRGTCRKASRLPQATTHPAQETRIFAAEEIN